MSSVARDAVATAWAVSAGIHAALAPGHFAEGATAGAGFVAATVLFAGATVAVTRRPESSMAALAAAAVLAGLLASYAAAAVTGLPGVQPEREPVEGLAVATKAIETVGLGAAVHLLRRGGGAVARPTAPLPLSALIAVFAGSSRSRSRREPAGTDTTR